MKIGIAQINPIVGRLSYNAEKICKVIEQAKVEHADLVLFPEMAVLGYPPEDLVLLPNFVEAVDAALQTIIQASKGIAVVVGCIRKNPLFGEKKLYNSAAIIHDGKLIGFQDKSLLPDYDVFSERRYFEPSPEVKLWNLLGVTFAVTICEDVWQHAKVVSDSNYPRDPVCELQQRSPAFVLNLSASPYHMHRHFTRVNVCIKAAQTLHCPIILCNQVGANDSLIFDGSSVCVDKNGNVVAQGKSFEEDFFVFDTNAMLLQPSHTSKADPIEELFSALVLGVHNYFYKQGFESAYLGLSGGIDSAIVACIAVVALGRHAVKTVFLPSRFSSVESREDAEQLAEQLGIVCEQISIEGPFQAFLTALEPIFRDLPSDHTEENLQARIRGTLLMALSNKFNCLVLSTGNKSEMGMGYMTLYGDMCGGLAVLSDVTKEQVYALAKWINRHEEIIPLRILTKPPTAELRPNQKDTDALPPYPIVDAVLQDYVENELSPEDISKKRGLSLDLVKLLVRKIHLNEYKRRQAPPGLRVTKKAFSMGRRFPIVQGWNL